MGSDIFLGEENRIIESGVSCQKTRLCTVNWDGSIC